MSLGNNIRRRRSALNLSQQDIADALGYKTRSSIAKLEKSDGPKKAEKIAKVNQRKVLLEKDLDELLKEKAEVEASQS